MRRKEFWALPKTGSLLHTFIPAVSHESDGLIFQAYDDAYEPGTCSKLLKWKFAHLNSVDFRLRCESGRDAAPALELLETRASAPRRRGYHVLEDAVVTFPGGVDPHALHHAIVECSWDAEAQTWVYMRERRDKHTPNAYHVYESVEASIRDNILEADVLHCVDDALRRSIYDEDTGRGRGARKGED